MPATPEDVQVILRNGGAVLVTNVIGQPVQVDVPTIRRGTTNSTTTVAMLLTQGVYTGMPVRGPGIPDLTFVTAVTGTSVTISNAATASATVTLAFGDGYYDGDTWRNELDSTYLGAPIGAQTDYSSTPGYPVNKDDSYNVIPPRFHQLARTQTQFSRQDANGNVLPMRWFWSDEILGLGDGGETF